MPATLFYRFLRQPFGANVRRDHPAPQIKHIDVELQRARELIQYRPPRYAETIVFDVSDPLLRDCLAAPAFNSRRKFHLSQTQFLAPARDELAERLHPFVLSRFVAEPPDMPRFLFSSTAPPPHPRVAARSSQTKRIAAHISRRAGEKTSRHVTKSDADVFAQAPRRPQGGGKKRPRF